MRGSTVALQGTFVEATDVEGHARGRRLSFADHLVGNAGLPGLAFDTLNDDEVVSVDPLRTGWVEAGDFPVNGWSLLVGAHDQEVARREREERKRLNAIAEAMRARRGGRVVVIRRGTITPPAVVLPEQRDTPAPATTAIAAATIAALAHKWGATIGCLRH